jgi:transcriptional antiterminator RfaH
MDRWYVVHTQPNAEAKALAHLRNQRFRTYLPRVAKRRRHARKVEEIAAPLFPRYLFVRLDLAAERWRAIRSTVGVADLVAHGDAPAPVPHGVVEAIRAREDERGLVVLGSAADFRQGDRVTIAEGALEGCVGLFEAATDDERVIVLLELLGREVRVRVPPAALRATA